MLLNSRVVFVIILAVTRLVFISSITLFLLKVLLLPERKAGGRKHVVLSYEAWKALKLAQLLYDQPTLDSTVLYLVKCCKECRGEKS